MMPTLNWTENGNTRSALWRSEAGNPPPKRVVLADDTIKADLAYRLACEGSALLWRGDYQNARQLLQALARRLERKPAKPASSMTEAFHLHRQAQAQRARILGMILIPLDADYRCTLRRGPDLGEACREAWGDEPQTEGSVLALREALGLVGAHEWRKKGVLIPALSASIHPHYGVFSPIRGEYLELVAQAPLPAPARAAGARAFDIGTGTGVLAALLARRGLQVIATDNAPRALNCAQDNLQRLGLQEQVEVLETDLFPPGLASLVVCNPPWLPGRPSSPLETAVYDPDSRMLKGFIAGASSHLASNGEAWLILSDLAEHLGLRSRETLLSLIGQAGLQVLGRLDVKPRHRKAQDSNDPLFHARAQEVTSLWRLALL